MSHEDIPEDTRESYPCQICAAGDIILIDGIWQCNRCGSLPETNQL